MMFSEFMSALLVTLITGGFGVIWTGVEVRNLRRWYRLRAEGQDMRDQIFGSYMMLVITLGSITGVTMHWL